MQISLPSNQLYLPDYEAEKSKCHPTKTNIKLLGRCIDFITTFQDPRLPEDPIHSKLKYQILMVSPPPNYCLKMKTHLQKVDNT